MPAHKGQIAWNKGLTKETDERVRAYGIKGGKTKKGTVVWNKGLTKEMDDRIRKISENMKGNSNPKGCKRSIAHREAISKSKIGEQNPAKRTDVRRKNSESQLARFKDPRNHPLWQGGKSYELYGLEFNKRLKEKIRERDNYTCQLSGLTEEQLGYKLTVHHIDYNKKNNVENNLISLNKAWNAKVNFNREYWEKHLTNKLGYDR